MLVVVAPSFLLIADAALEDPGSSSEGFGFGSFVSFGMGFRSHLSSSSSSSSSSSELRRVVKRVRGVVVFGLFVLKCFDLFGGEMEESEDGGDNETEGKDDKEEAEAEEEAGFVFFAAAAVAPAVVVGDLALDFFNGLVLFLVFAFVVVLFFEGLAGFALDLLPLRLS